MKQKTSNTPVTCLESMIKENISSRRRNSHLINKIKGKRSRKSLLSASKPKQTKLTVNPNLNALLLKKSTLSPELVNMVFNHLKNTRNSHSCRINPLTNQTQVNALMRMVLLNWILEIIIVLKLSRKTFYLVIHIIDRYLAHKTSSKEHLQLLGITALFMASKFEDICPPKLRYLCYLCEDVYNPKDIVQLESEILMLLDFNLVIVTPVDFIDIFSLHFGFDESLSETAQMISHLLMLHAKASCIDILKVSAYACDLAAKLRGLSSISFFKGFLSKKEVSFYRNWSCQILKVIDKYELLGMYKMFGNRMTALTCFA